MNMAPPRRTELLEPLRLFQREMDEVVERFFGDTPEGTVRNGLTVWAPRVDVEEDDKQYVVKADLPGIKPDEVEISVVDNILTLHGQTKMEREEKDKKNYHRVERFEGEFYRE